LWLIETYILNIVEQKKACRETSLLYMIKYYSSVTSRRVDVSYSTTKYVLFDFSFCQIYFKKFKIQNSKFKIQNLEFKIRNLEIGIQYTYNPRLKSWVIWSRPFQGFSTVKV